MAAVKTKVLAVIPARYQSKRFPGKPLAIVNGKPILQHIYIEASKARLIDRVVVATDSKIIKSGVESFGGEALMTSKRHRTGSDRAAEVASKLGGNIVLNIQADHVGVSRQNYDAVLDKILSDKKIKYASIVKKIDNEADLFDPNRVKVILDSHDNALWFSRYPLPFLQNINGNWLGTFNFHYHIGVYIFRKAALERFSNWPRSPLEKAESLEQLRILENHEKIRLFKIKSRVLSIDTHDDLKKVESLLT
jgi:3-deoxy-manno-octulosonate cytidylyltransferase (CMP-KDO synthetase)